MQLNGCWTFSTADDAGERVIDQASQAITEGRDAVQGVRPLLPCSFLALHIYKDGV